MSKNSKDWGAIFAQYKGSNLSKKDFCKEGLSWNQFRYRWDRKNLLKTGQSESLIVERSHSAKASFEAVSIISSCEPKELMNINEVSIYLPNHVRCDIKINFEANQFTTLLKQLVSLC